jgi:pantoate--beta-alanine ligase
MNIARSISSVRNLVNIARRKGYRIGFVPTMGALHAGHTSLIEKAVRQTDFVVVSIFVNPTQFGPSEDFAKYPRTLKNDLLLCRQAGADVVFIPSVKQIYPHRLLSWVSVDMLSENLCGRSRPGHFRGVATVCTKLFNIVCPDVAFFGQKDAQQAIIISKMVADLNLWPGHMPLKIVICPTIRESSGLAISSRNRYLTPHQRNDAACLYKALQTCRRLFRQGTKDTAILIRSMKNIIIKVPNAKIDYLSIVDTETLQPLKTIKTKALAALAVKIGSTRLIDNIILNVKK